MMHNKYILVLFSFTILFGVENANSQSNYTLDQALFDATKNAPSTKIIDALISENALIQKNLSSKYLPQIGFSAQATYQSETTGLDLNVPGFSIDRLSRDQYKAVLEVNQILFDGGSISIQKKMKSTSSALETESSKVDIEQTKEQVINVYFAILELEKRLAILDLKETDIEASLKKMETAFNSGAVLKSSLNELQAEKLALVQKQIEINSIKSIQFSNLSILTGQTILENTKFDWPKDLNSVESKIENKPMLRWFSLNKMQIMQAKDLESSLSKPRAGLFVQGGYGKPGLNFLKNEFTPYYIAGIRINWNLNNMYTSSNDAQINKLQLQRVDFKKQAYTQQLDAKIASYKEEIIRFKLMLHKDTELIQLRKQIKETAESQLTSGAITSNDFIIKLNAESEAKINEELHKIMLLKAAYLLQLHSGSYIQN